MRNLHIILLHFEHVFEYRLRSFIWFISAMLNPMIMILFWHGAVAIGKSNISLSYINTYYLLLVIAGSLLISHIEEDVSYRDIQQGNLVKYLLKPLSYYWIKVVEEIPFRVLQGFYGLSVITVIFFLFGNILHITKDPLSLLLALIILVLAFFISFTFKMIVGMIAFWTTDIGGTNQIVEILIIVFAGFTIPLNFMPEILQKISYSLPFAYMIYFPVISLQGILPTQEMVVIIAKQLIWLAILGGIYKYMWYSGIRRFTGVGN